MRRSRIHLAACVAGLAILSSGSAAIATDDATKPVVRGRVDGQRIQADERSGDNWLTYGRTYSEQRFSPLTQINDRNVKELGLAWSADIASPDGLGATPIVVDDTIYMSGSLGLVVAIAVETGKERWNYRPDQLNLTTIFSSWTSRFNRGVAVWKGKVFVATGDCRLFALDAATGKKVWEVESCNIAEGYGSTGAPRVAKNMVLIGNSGSDMQARGYVSAYDMESGRLIWRFFTVPGDPAKGFEQPILKKAAQTWIGKEWWRSGGGSVWDSIVYDPEFDQVLFGTDTTLPWDATTGPGAQRGDSLLTNSIVAVDADTGRYRWHYQQTPGDAWDYSSTPQIVLADLEIGGQDRKVLMHAPKNGFFYVLDRRNGKLLSAEKFVTVTWASHVDLESGRPVVNPAARFYLHPSRRVEVAPYVNGGHSWHAMSFSPLTRLAYIPATDAAMTYSVSAGTGLGATNLDFHFAEPGEPSTPLGQLIAWDPVEQKARWTVNLKYPINGGTLATAGNLVFQGTADGNFNAWNATDGRRLWTMPVVSATQAPPVTFRHRGKQYVLLPVGASGVSRAYLPEYGNPPSARGPSRLLAFVLGGKGTVPPELVAQREVPVPPRQFASADVIEQGRKLYHQASCFICHGARLEVAADGSFRDLRYIPQVFHDRWNQIVLEGELQSLGMPAFKGTLSESDAQAIRAFVISEAQKLYDASKKAQ